MFIEIVIYTLAVFLLAMFRAMMPDIATHNRSVLTCDCHCLVHLGQCDKKETVSPLGEKLKVFLEEFLILCL